MSLREIRKEEKDLAWLEEKSIQECDEISEKARLEKINEDEVLARKKKEDRNTAFLEGTRKKKEAAHSAIASRLGPKKKRRNAAAANPPSKNLNRGK